MVHIKVTDKELSIEKSRELVSDVAAGGTVVFVGTVRNHTAGKKVIRLEFEAYEPMAEKEMRKIAEEVEEKWEAVQVVFFHRVGVLYPTEIPVIIAVATPHRKAAFEACEYAIDRLKERVPIWKKEIFENGEEWVSAHP